MCYHLVMMLCCHHGAFDLDYLLHVFLEWGAEFPPRMSIFYNYRVTHFQSWCYGIPGQTVTIICSVSSLGQFVCQSLLVSTLVLPTRYL